jgi:hypothetical protein
LLPQFEKTIEHASLSTRIAASISKQALHFAQRVPNYKYEENEVREDSFLAARKFSLTIVDNF